MSIINDFKKLLFGAKAIGKSAAESAKEKGKDALEELEHTSAEAMDKAKEFAEDLGDKAVNVAENVGKKILDVTGIADDKTTERDNDVMDDIMKDSGLDSSETEDKLDLPNLGVDSAAQSKSQISEEQIPSDFESTKDALLEKGKEALDKAGDYSEMVGEKVLEKGDELMGKLGNNADELGEQLIDKGGKAIDKAKELAEDLGAKLLRARDELVKKAEEEAAKEGEVSKDIGEKLSEINKRIEDAISGNNKKFADKPLDLGGSELKKHDSFFEKAKRFADGDYQSKKPRITNDQPASKSESGKVKGFDDMDGDGDEIIDDAIIDES